MLLFLFHTHNLPFSIHSFICITTIFYLSLFHPCFYCSVPVSGGIGDVGGGDGGGSNDSSDGGESDSSILFEEISVILYFLLLFFCSLPAYLRLPVWLKRVIN